MVTLAVAVVRRMHHGKADGWWKGSNAHWLERHSSRDPRRKGSHCSYQHRTHVGGRPAGTLFEPKSFRDLFRSPIVHEIG
jgi:hypothetical protein